MIPPKKILFLIPILLVLQGCSAFRPELQSKQNSIDLLLSSDFFNSAQIGISVYDLTDNKQIYRKNDKLLLRPASNQKILTTAAAYLFLGSDYKFITSVYHTGDIIDSVCTGDLYISGGFDPEFTSGDLDSLVRQIKNFGIRKVEGGLYGDISAMDSLFWGEGWSWDDDPAPFAPYLTPLCINKNSVQVAYEPGISGKPARIKLIPDSDYFRVVNSSITADSRISDFTVTRNWINRDNTILVKGKISRLAQPDTISLNVFNPAFYFLALMRESLERNGISLQRIVDTSSVKTGSVKIFSFERDLNPVISNANKKSDNLNAEMILRALSGITSKKSASAKKGIMHVDSLITLTGLNPNSYRIADGSGLSNYNLLSAELIIEVQKYLYYKHPLLFNQFFNSLSVSGSDGTLINRMKEPGLYKNIHGKTGSLSGVSNLSGVLQSRNNHLIAFSILMQNFTGDSDRAKSIQDEICKLIFESN